MMSQKTADYNQNPQIATQKMPTAFFATDLQQATGNYTHLLNNRVNNPIAYIPIIIISSNFPMQYCPYRLYINCRADIKRKRSIV